MEKFKLYLVIAIIGWCKGVSLRSQLDHIAKRRAESQGLFNENYIPSRRSFYEFDPREASSIVGVPSLPNHLPEAEPILPGHTLIRPSLGMLKSAVKFPHKELEDGAGVYGNIENLGLRYDMKNERVLNTGFRRRASDYIMIVPSESQHDTPKFQIASAVFDTEKNDFSNKLMKALEKLKVPLNRGNTNIYIASVNPEENPFDNVQLKYTIDQDPIVKDSKEKLREWWFIKQGDDKEKHNEISPNSNDNDEREENFKYTEVFEERPKRFVPVHSKYLFKTLSRNKIHDTKEILRDKDSRKLKLNPVSDSSEEVITSSVPIVHKVDTRLEKMKWYLNTQHTFDHVKLNDNAPNQEEFMPKDTKEKIRQWWFFNQQDYKTFSEES